jgi:hypothetical protein
LSNLDDDSGGNAPAVEAILDGVEVELTEDIIELADIEMVDADVLAMEVADDSDTPELDLVVLELLAD